MSNEIFMGIIADKDAEIADLKAKLAEFQENWHYGEPCEAEARLAVWESKESLPDCPACAALAFAEEEEP